MKAIEKIQQIKGGTYIYNTRRYTINDVVIENDTVYISTDSKIIKKSLSEISDFLENILPCDMSQESNEIAKAQGNQIAQSFGFAKLTDIIYDNIDKIQQNASYIPQAQAINEQVETIVNIAKTQIEAIKIIKNL